jgi:hypothetical protein
MAQPDVAQVDGTQQQSLDQIADTLDEIKNTLERIARALETAGAD